MQISLPLRGFMVAALAGCLSLPVAAETPPKKRSLSKVTKLGLPQLPKPLELVTGNLHELEQNGLFTVTDVRVNTVGVDRQDAIVWTLRVNRPVTCRRVVMFLDAYRDIRFYLETDQRVIEVFSGMLHYDHSIKTGAANAEILPRDSIVHAFMFLAVGDIVRLERAEPNQVVFSRSSERNLFRNLDKLVRKKKTYKVPEGALVKDRDRPGYR